MRNDIFDKKLENLIDASVSIAVEQLDSEMSDVNENIVFSEEFESDMAKLFANGKAKKPAPVSKARAANAGGRFKVFSKYVAHAAVVMLFLATATVVVIQGVNEGNDLGGAIDRSNGSIEIGDLYMTYVPYGFELYEKDTENGRIFARFANDDLYFKINVDESRENIEVTGNIYADSKERIIENAEMLCC